MDATSPSDRHAFESLVHQHQAAVCATAYAVLRDRARSEDVAQEAFLVAWRERSRVTATAGWICGIARNLARNAARRRKEVVMDVEPIATTHDARDELIVREEAARANAALAKLPERYREAVVLYYRNEQSIADVARALGISEDSARQRVHRGRTRLRELVAPVEATLRATRPGPAFAAACIAAWALGRSTTASAAVARAVPSKSWLGVALCGGVVAGSIAIGVAIRSGPTIDREGAALVRAAPVDPRASLQRQFPPMVHPHRSTLPPGFTAIAVTAPTTRPAALPSSGRATLVDLDFGQAPVEAIVRIFANMMETPMWLTIDGTISINVKMHQVPALEALDETLAQAGASRTEVAAIRIVPGGRSDAATLGGASMTASFHATPLNEVLTAIEPKLAMPIGRLGHQPVQGESDGSGHPMDDLSQPVTLDLHETPAGVALEQALQQTGYGYELTTGFVIAPNDD